MEQPTQANCPLCLAFEPDSVAPNNASSANQAQEALLFAHPLFRVIRADEAGFPAFYRLIWQTHVAEFSDLSEPHRILCMQAVYLIEKNLRLHTQADKINLACLGNMVAHLHWHIVARFSWDSHFPNSVWGQAQRGQNHAKIQQLRARLPAAEAAIQKSLTDYLTQTS